MNEDEYEQERLENIRKNRELLLSLGLAAQQSPGTKSSVSSLKRKVVSKSPLEATRKSQRPKSARPARFEINRRKVIEPERKSARLSGRDAISYAEDKELRTGRISPEFPRAPTLKRLRNPSPPPGTEDEMQVYESQSLPRRDGRGNILFENNNRHFMPNVTPKEMLQGGIFGGTAFRPYFSRVKREQLNPEEEMAEFPQDWFENLDVETQLCSPDIDIEKNRFGVKAGQTLEEWESAGWIRAQDARGWWQWYFRFYLGRRTSDDARQIGRWQKACGPAGRFKRSLVQKIHQARSTWDDETISPVVRQTLFHWAYQLTEHDYHAYLPE